MREDRSFLMLTHLSQLITLIIGFGSLILPLILWATNKEKVHQLDEQGKEIINFQLSILIYSLISIPMILFFGLGILLLIVIGLISIIYPIINAIKAGNGEPIFYPLSLRFLG
jgi:uncharacterized Tic20 family protein